MKFVTNRFELYEIKNTILSKTWIGWSDTQNPTCQNSDVFALLSWFRLWYENFLNNMNLGVLTKTTYFTSAFTRSGLSSRLIL